MTFPSGVLLGEFDVELLLSLGSLGFAVLVGRREDAEGDRDAGFKVQVGDLCGARVLSSTTFRLRAKGRQEDSSCSSFYKSERKEGRRRKRMMLASLLDSLVQVQA